MQSKINEKLQMFTFWDNDRSLHDGLLDFLHFCGTIGRVRKIGWVTDEYLSIFIYD